MKRNVDERKLCDTMVAQRYSETVLKIYVVYRCTKWQNKRNVIVRQLQLHTHSHIQRNQICVQILKETSICTRWMGCKCGNYQKNISSNVCHGHFENNHIFHVILTWIQRHQKHELPFGLSVTSRFCIIWHFERVRPLFTYRHKVISTRIHRISRWESDKKKKSTKAHT